MAQRIPHKSHRAELDIIQHAIEEYATTNKTQKECAKQFGISQKVLSYYILNGSKTLKKKMALKNNAMTGGAPQETAQPTLPKSLKKAKLRESGFEHIIIEGSEPAPQSNQQIRQPMQQPLHQLTQQPIKEAMQTTASVVNKPVPHFDLDQYL
jgi:plasmid maintenance system antidote protein VapI